MEAIFSNVESGMELGILHILGRLLATFVLAIFVSFIYQAVVSRRPKNALDSLVVLSLCVCVTLMAIGNSIPHSFGLFAALALIRFRTPVKDTQELVFIFFSIVVGIACGLGYFKVAAVSTVFIGAAVLLLQSFNFTRPALEKYLLRLQLDSEFNEATEKDVQSCLERFSSNYRFLEARGGSTGVEVAYELTMKEGVELSALHGDLNKVAVLKSFAVQAGLGESLS